MHIKRLTSGWLGSLICLLAGAVIPLSFAPFNFWPAGILAPPILALLLIDQPRGRSWLRSLLFGFGLFGAGASWVYISIHDFGRTPIWLALIMTGLFVGFLALVFSLPFYLFRRWFTPDKTTILIGFPAVWVLSEWLRSWLLTGFPWLYSGYAHIDTWLAGWAPIFGVYGLSLFVVTTGCGIVWLGLQLRGKANQSNHTNIAPPTRLQFAIPAALLVVIWGGGALLEKIEWTHFNDDDKVEIAIIQPNIPLEVKWNPFYRTHILDTLLALSEPHWDADLILWPEAAIPLMYSEADEFLAEVETLAAHHNTALISGIIFDDREQLKYFNSILGLGAASQIYFKQRLVPFGEYVPLEKYLRGLIEFFDLPNSIIHPGPRNQHNLQTADYAVAPYICYEVVYPDLVAANLDSAELMLTISNDAWFGDSIGPLQHFQMAQMRALENGRYMIRGTNTGLSGIISNKGKIETSGSQFVQEAVIGTAYRTHGSTPFSKIRSYPTVIFCFAILLALILRRSWQ